MTPNEPIGTEGWAVNPAMIIARGIEEGLSGRAIIGALQNAGVGLRWSTVYRTIGEVRAAIANREMVAGMPTNRLPTGDEYAKWTTNRTGYSTQMLVVTRDRTTGLIGTSTSSYTTRDQHTIDEALQNKLADVEQMAEGSDTFGDQQILGVVPWNIFQMGPE